MIKDDLYASHLPILAKIVEHTYGPILELGMGYSTVMLHAMCKQKNRLLVSYETDLKWYERYREFASESHLLNHLPDMNELITEYIDWSVVFIDNRPARSRRELAMKLRYKADFILLHDSEPEQDKFFGYKKIYPEFKYVYQYTDCKPNTAVLSNFRDLSFLNEHIT